MRSGWTRDATTRSSSASTFHTTPPCTTLGCRRKQATSGGSNATMRTRARRRRRGAYRGWDFQSLQRRQQSQVRGRQQSQVRERRGIARDRARSLEIARYQPRDHPRSREITVQHDGRGTTCPGHVADVSETCPVGAASSAAPAAGGAAAGGSGGSAARRVRTAVAWTLEEDAVIRRGVEKYAHHHCE